MARKDTRRVTVVFGSETRGAEQGFQRVRGEAGDLDKKTGRLREQFDKLGPAIIAAVGVASAGEAFRQIIGGAINLNETVNKTRQVFKQSSGAVESWANGAAKGLGMSKQAALDGASAFGNMFTQVGLTETTARKMSLRMVELASDFASFHNAQPAEVMQALQAATRGEYDALQKFVPTVKAAKIEMQAMSDTGKTTAKSLTDAEKATALYNIVVKDAGAAAGDFARTSGDAANQQRELLANLQNSAAQIGSVVLPVYQTLLRVLNDLGPVQTILAGLVIAFGSKITAAVATSRAAVVSWAASVRAAGVAARDAAASTTAFGGSIAFAGGAAKSAGGGIIGLARTAGPLAIFTSALVAVNAVISSLGKDVNPNVEVLSRQMEEFARTGKLSGEAARVIGDDFRLLKNDVKVLDDSFGASLSRKIGGFFEGLVGLSEGAETSIANQTERMKAHDAALSNLVSGGKSAEAEKYFNRIAEAAAFWGLSVEDVRRALPGYRSALELAALAQKDSEKSGDEYRKQLDAMVPALKGASTNVTDFETAIGSVGMSGEDSGTRLKEFSLISGAVAESNLDAADKAELFKSAISGVDQTAGTFSAKAPVLAGMFNNIANAEMNAKTKGDLLKGTIDALYGSLISQTEATERVEAAKLKLSQSLDENGQRFDLNSAKTAKHKDATLQNRDALQEAMLAVRDKYLADIVAGDNADVAREKYEKQTTEILGQIKPTKNNAAAVKDLKDRYMELPSKRSTKIETTGGPDALNQLIKAFALQHGLSKTWNKEQTTTYYNQLYREYIIGSNFIGPVARQELAGGGSVHGYSPNKRADNIPTWLTAKEYVQPVDAVNYYGVDIMEKLRRRAIPRELLTGDVVPDAIAGMRLNAGGPVWPFKVPMSGMKMPVNLTKLRADFDAMIAGGIIGNGSGPGGWPWQWNTLRKKFPGISLFSGFRKGSTTLSGNLSYHARGRAVDVTPRRDIAQWIKGTYGKNTKELITPWRDLMLHNGKPHKYSAAVERQHGVGNAGNDHIHWAYDNGGILPPGASSVVNRTGDNEYVLTPDQLADAVSPNVTVNVTVQGNVTAERDLAAAIAKSVRDEIVRIAKRNGGSSGI